MSEMKSAWERAMERVEKLGKPSEEELKRLEHIPTGNMLAARYLHEDNFDLDAELNKHKGTGIRQYIIQGAQEIFLRNITLPHDEQSKLTLSKSMKGIRLLKENKKQLDVVFDRINNLLSYYEQARQQAFVQFKKNFETKLEEISKSLQQRTNMGTSMEAELQQQFQEEWRRVSSDLDAQYEKALEEHRQQIIGLA